MPKLLVIDDEQSICWGIGRLGEEMGCEVTIASSAEQAFDLAEQVQPDVIVLDVRLPGMNGLAAMEQLRQLVGQVPILVMTAYGDMKTAAQAVQNGAFDYIVKPFDLQRLRNGLERAMSRDGSGNAEAVVHPVEGFVAQTPIMNEVFNRIALAAASDSGVLLQGESGTGKELAARAIHKFSSRADAPFVVVNVASLSGTLVESELFGHVRGAFTGAEESRTGLLTQANGGTLFLDEVAEIPLAVQVKLLRALEQREVLPVGATTSVPADFRLVSATHRNLLRFVQAENFRHDLYYRIAAFQIELPPLRKRRDDIIPLAKYFLQELTSEADSSARLSTTTCELLTEREWPGNVRELRNAIEHAVIVSRGGTIDTSHLPASNAPLSLDAYSSSQDSEKSIANLLNEWTAQRLHDGTSDGTLYEDLLSLVEPIVLGKVLQEYAGQVATAARVLGLHRTTLTKKLEQQRKD